jgi:hypothetical protein
MYNFTLPNGIEIEGKLFNKVQLDELTGKQQNYLINTKYKTPLDHLEPLLSDLILKIQTEDGQELTAPKLHIIKDLLSLDDLTFILVKLREITFGEQFFFNKAECPHCKSKQAKDVVVFLDKLEIIESKKKPQEDLKLPKSGLQIKYKPLTLGVLKSYAGDQDRLLNSAFTATMSMILAQLGDKTTVTEKDVEPLKAKDISFIEDNAPTYNKLDTEIVHECTECGKDFNLDMGVLSSDFFVRTRI